MPAGSACIPSNALPWSRRRSLASSAFPGGAWERGASKLAFGGRCVARIFTVRGLNGPGMFD